MYEFTPYQSIRAPRSLTILVNLYYHDDFDLHSAILYLHYFDAKKHKKQHFFNRGKYHTFIETKIVL